MDYTMDSGAKRRLEGFFTQVGDVLANVKRRASFATYALGLLSEGERKSIEPIAARACASPDNTSGFRDSSPTRSGVTAAYAASQVSTRLWR
jgi:SRSO17 transposase